MAGSSSSSGAGSSSPRSTSSGEAGDAVAISETFFRFVVVCWWGEQSRRPSFTARIHGWWVAQPHFTKKTSLYINPEVDRALDRRAAAEGVTEAEFVRRVLSAAVSERPRGVFDGPRDLGSEAERHLAETDFGEG